MAPLELLQLTGDDGWPLWRAARLAALADSPDAFTSAPQEWPLGGEERWRERLVDGAQLKVVAVRDGAPIGLVRGALEDGYAWLHSLWVSPQARGQGLGTRLVAAVETWAGRTAIRLEVVPDNAPAIALYERLGYTDTGEPGELLASGARERVMQKGCDRSPR